MIHLNALHVKQCTRHCYDTNDLGMATDIQGDNK